ncbi:MAG: GTP cyclohydrolase II RibA [Spirochaetaceae bacterium]|nr:GTP cyclohydrolase II RibA [Spirochaetaceae bacterium]
MLKILASAIHHTSEYGDFRIFIVQEEENQDEHVVLIKGSIEKENNVLCRVSSECLPGTALFSAECDCKEQIQFSLKLISTQGKGLFIYLRQEGRGHGLVKKIQALQNKNKGLDTFSAVEQLGLPTDIRQYSIVKKIINYFNINSIAYITNNPDKIKLLSQEGITIQSVINIPISDNPISHIHLISKKEHGHIINFKNTEVTTNQEDVKL